MFRNVELRRENLNIIDNIGLIIGRETLRQKVNSLHLIIVILCHEVKCHLLIHCLLE